MGFGGVGFRRSKTMDRAMADAVKRSQAKKKAKDDVYKKEGIERVTDDVGLDRMLHKRPKYEGATNADGTLKDAYKAKKQSSNLNKLDDKLSSAKNVKTKAVKTGDNFKSAKANIKSLEKRAFGTGPSKWAESRMQLADAESLQARNQMVQDSGRATQAGLNSMAQQGGLEGGSRERMMASAAKNRMMSQQGLSRQNQQAKLGITADDENQRLQLQSQLPGMNLQTDAYSTGLQTQNAARDLSAQQFNTDTSLKKANMWGNMADSESGRNQQVALANQNVAVGDNSQRNQHQLGGWQTGMEAYGASKTAAAQNKAAQKQKSSGLLGMGTGIL